MSKRLVAEVLGSTALIRIDPVYLQGTLSFHFSQSLTGIGLECVGGNSRLRAKMIRSWAGSRP